MNQPAITPISGLSGPFYDSSFLAVPASGRPKHPEESSVAYCYNGLVSPTADAAPDQAQRRLSLTPEQVTQFRHLAMIQAITHLVNALHTGSMVLLLCLLALAGMQPEAGGAEPPIGKEYEVKAAFLYNFTKFLDWPTSSFPAPSSPIVLGVWGENPAFAAALEEAVKDRKVNERYFIVRPIESVAQAKEVHVLFIGSADDKTVAGLLQTLDKSSVLTVGETEAFAAGGGMIRFVMQEGKIRFEINMSAADRAKLRVSAQLQKLAKSVRQGR